ncbi:MAG: IS66 family transposase [Enterocloster clostridioformis]
MDTIRWNSLRDQFQGYFTCDGYQAYHAAFRERIAVTGCMAHVRLA